MTLVVPQSHPQVFPNQSARRSRAQFLPTLQNAVTLIGREMCMCQQNELRKVRIAAILIMAAILSGQAPSLHAQKKPAPAWTPATYRGLTVGSSSKDDVFRVLGRPSTISNDSDSGELWNYQVSDPFPGLLEAYIKDGTTLGGFTLSLSRLVTRSAIIKMFGPNYRYSKRSIASGPLEMLAYPDRGIAIILQFENNEAADLIIYSVKPVNPR